MKNSARCINYALNLAKSNRKVSIRKILEDLNHCRNSINLNSNSNWNSNSNENKIENVDLEMQNADFVQSTQNAQNPHNENTTYNIKKMKSFNIESGIKKTIDAKMKKIQSHLESKLNQTMNLIQPRGITAENQGSKSSNFSSLISLIPIQYKDQNASKIASSSNS